MIGDLQNDTGECSVRTPSPKWLASFWFPVKSNKQGTLRKDAHPCGLHEAEIYEPVVPLWGAEWRNLHDLQTYCPLQWQGL